MDTVPGKNKSEKIIVSKYISPKELERRLENYEKRN